MQHRSYSEVVRFRAPEGFGEAISAAAARDFTTSSEFVRRIIVDRLRALGMDLHNRSVRGGGMTSGGYSKPNESARRTKETYSNGRGYSDAGGWGLSSVGDQSGFMDGSIYGGGGGSYGDGGSYSGSRGDGSYGDRSSQDDNNPQGIL